eukprot:scaffold1500_cov398-Prasinococcus_capsulatus_cf.AAC.18
MASTADSRPSELCSKKRKHFDTESEGLTATKRKSDISRPPNPGERGTGGHAPFDAAAAVPALKLALSRCCSSATDIINVGATCKAWRTIATDDDIWRTLALRYFPRALHALEAFHIRNSRTGQANAAHAQEPLQGKIDLRRLVVGMQRSAVCRPSYLKDCFPKPTLDPKDLMLIVELYYPLTNHHAGLCTAYNRWRAPA